MAATSCLFSEGRKKRQDPPDKNATGSAQEVCRQMVESANYLPITNTEIIRVGSRRMHSIKSRLFEHRDSSLYFLKPLT